MIIRIIIPYKTEGLGADANIFFKMIKKINPNIIVKIDTEDYLKNNISQDIDDVHIYISNTDSSLLKYAKTKMFMINHELFMQKESDLEILKEMDYILARNKIGLEWAQQIKDKHKLKYEVKLIKFSTDFEQRDIPKIYNMILHSAGQHHWKQTDAIIKCWNKYKDLPVIVITCTEQCYRNIKNLINPNNKNIVLYNYLLEKEKFIELKNKIGIHLCPSIVEGFGHYINEARKVKSLVITSDLAPMNELINQDTGILIKCDEIGKKKNGADLCFINEDSIYKAVKEAINLDINVRKKMIVIAYEKYLADVKYFEDSMRELLNEI